ncbi:MAG: hypothetical protein AAGC77_05195 [Pseudomonadota bacterium]
MKSFVSFIAAASAAGAAVFASSFAQSAQISNPNALASNFDAQTIGPVLDEMGIVWRQHNDRPGAPYITANFAGEVNFYLQPGACRQSVSDCVGLSMFAFFQGAANEQTVRAFNYRYAFASAGISPDGIVYIGRYEISDFGIPRGNLATSIVVFAEQARMLGQELSTAQRTVSLEGFAQDLEARALNRQALIDLTGVDIPVTNAFDRHQQGLDEMTAHIRSFVADGSAPRNKIDNIAQ